jgi:hypothetical protein
MFCGKHPTKSFKLHLPELPSKYLHHFYLMVSYQRQFLHTVVMIMITSFAIKTLCS